MSFGFTQIKMSISVAIAAVIAFLCAPCVCVSASNSNLIGLQHSVVDSLVNCIAINDMDGVRWWNSRFASSNISPDSVVASNTEADDARRVAICMQAFVDLLEGKRGLANEVVDETIDFYCRRTDSIATRALAVAYCVKGYLLYETYHDEADRFYKKAEKCALIYGDNSLYLLCLYARCHLYYRAQRFVEAAYCARQLLSLSSEAGNGAFRFRAQLALFRTYSSINADAAAEDYVQDIERDGFYNSSPSAAIAYYQVVAEDRCRSNQFGSALGYVDKALELGESGNISMVHLWQLHLLKASIFIEFGQPDVAMKHIDFCRKHINVVDPRCTDGSYSRFHVNLLEVHVAVLQGRFVEAERNLARSDIPSVMLTRINFVMRYYAILEQIFCSEGDFYNARQTLMEINAMRRNTQAEHARMRTKDMEIAYREDPTIISQRQALVNSRNDLSSLQFQIGLWVLIATAIALSAWLVYMARHKRSQRLKRKRDAEYNKMLKEEVEAKTATFVKQNQLLMQKNADIEASASYARRLQHGILPDPNGLALLGVPNSFVIRNTAESLEGCFYWFRRFDNRLFIVCANSVDAGVPGAMLSMVGVTVVNDVIAQNQNVTCALDILHEVDFRLDNLLPKSSDINGFEMSVAVVDFDTSKISVASARQDVMFISNGVAQLVVPSVELVGGNQEHEDDEDFVEESFDFKPGDELFLFTSALVNILNVESGEELGIERLRDICLEVGRMNVALRRDALANALQLWSGGRRSDDFLLIDLSL